MRPTPDVPVIRLVLDNLNTHRMASLYETFPAAEARRIAKRLEFHHTPKHGSWLNMAEIEFSVLARACLRGRNGDEDSLERAVSACVSERNAIGATINWRFTAQDARRKLHRLLSLPILIWFSTSGGPGKRERNENLRRIVLEKRTPAGCGAPPPPPGARGL